MAAVAESHGWFQTAPFAWDPAAAVLRRVERLPGGGVGRIELTAGDGWVDVRPDRPLDGRDRAAVEGRVRRMLQLDREVDGLVDAAAAVDPGLAHEISGAGGGRLLCGADLFEDVVKALCASNITWRQAVVAINRVAALGPEGAFPAPEELLRAGEGFLRAEARVGYRAPFLLGAARAAIDGRLAEVEEAAGAGDSARTLDLLRGLAGVGPATAAFLALLLGRYDRPAVDSSTIRMASRIWFDGRRPTPREVIRRVEPAGPYAGLVLYWATMSGWRRETGIGG